MSVTVNSIVADSDRNFFYNAVGGSSSKSLSLSFTSGSLDSKVTYARTGNATRVNSSGYIETVGTDVPRFDYDPVTLACRGLLVEGTVSNKLYWSEDLRTSAEGGGGVEWTQNPDANVDTVIDSSVTNPGGNTTTCKIRCSVSGAVQKQVYQTLSLAAATIHTASVYAKAGQCQYIKMLLTSKDASVTTVVFDLSGGTVVSATGAQLIESGILNAGNGWYRCWAAWSTASGASTDTFALDMSTVAGGSYNGAINDGYFAWGTQVEVGQGVTSYIPNTSALNTRNLDAVSITGANFSSWFTQTEGVLFVSGFAQSSAQLNASTALEVNDGTSANRHIIYREALNKRAHATSYQAGVSIADNVPLTNTWLNGTFAKVAYAYSSTKYQIAVNGTATASVAASALPNTLDRMRIGDNSTATRPFNGCISQIDFYAKAVFDTQLATITV